MQNQDLLNRDLGNTGNGIFSDGTVFKAWGIELKMTTILPNSDVTYGANRATPAVGVRNRHGYSVNGSPVAALCIQREALAKAVGGGMTLMTKDLEFEYGGTAMAAEMAFGYEVFRPKNCAVVATTDTAA